MKLKFLFILILFGFKAFSQKKTSLLFEEQQVDSIDTQIDSILLIGVGSTTTRIFLDDLSRLIIEEFNGNNIMTDYYYLGRTVTEFQPKFDSIDKKKYKAILFFLPKGESFFDIQGDLIRSSSNTAIGPISIATATSRIAYEQDFDFQLCLPGVDMKKVWTATLEVTGDLSKSKNAKKISAKLLYYFKKNKYIK